MSREVEELNRRLLRARDAMDRSYAETYYGIPAYATDGKGGKVIARRRLGTSTPL